jgi:hypothetical protein
MSTGVNHVLWGQKLSANWSSGNPGVCSLLTAEQLIAVNGYFGRLETAVKARTLLSLVHLPADKLKATNVQIQELIATALTDEDEWVRVTAGLVQYWLLSPADRRVDKDSFLEKMFGQAASGLDTGSNGSGGEKSAAFVPFELGYLNTENKLPDNCEAHFQLRGGAISTTTPTSITSTSSSSSSSSAAVPKPRFTVNPGAAPSPTSAVRASAAAVQSLKSPGGSSNEPSSLQRSSSFVSSSKLKRPRSKMVMIDIDEVKRLEDTKKNKGDIEGE